MKRYIKKIVSEGDSQGNEMAVQFQLPSGSEIYGLPTKNFYGGHWDLGPTWNYAVMADQPFLVDTGRFGQGKILVGMMKAAGIVIEDREFVLISHSHEDHDGGLAELVESTRLNVKAHAVYNLLIRQYPDDAPPGYKENFPAKCWHCPNEWVLPKGHIEPGVNPKETAVREIREESGIWARVQADVGRISFSVEN